MQLVVAASGGGSGGSPCLARRHARAPRLRRARSNALVRSAAAGSAADGQQASTASTVGADSNSSSSSSNNGSSSSSRSGSGSGGSRRSSSSGTASTNGSGQGSGTRRRELCLPPLPFWAAGVSVVGLPGDQLVFSFLTPSEAAAAARRQLRPELPYGPAALKLATLQGDKVQAILDRWQYAIAQRELGSLDARPTLWWRYESALKGAGGGSTGGGGGDDGTRGSPSGSFDEEAAAAAPDETVYTKRQLRRMARVAKAAAKAADHTQHASPSSSRANSKGRPAGSREDARHNGSSSSGSGGAEQQARGGLVIDQAAFEPGWQVCTLRGLPDGTTIYKFGTEFEPVVVGPQLSGATAGAAPADAFDAVPAATAAGAAGGPVAGFSPDSPPGGEAGAWWRQEQRPELGKLLLVQEQQRSIEGTPWSSALRLGVRFSGHARSVLKKLQIFTSEYEQQQSSSIQLNSRLHPTYEKALARVKRAQLGDAEVEAQQAQGGQQDAAQRQQWEQQRQQEARRARTDRQQETTQQQQAQAQAQAQAQQQVSTESGSSAALLAEQPFREQQAEPQLAEQQQRDAAAQARLEAEAAPHSSSSSSSAAAVAEASSEEEQEWQSELLPRPQWQPPAAAQRAQTDAAVTEDSEKHAPAGAASHAEEQPQQGVHQAASVWAQLATLAAAVGAAMLRLLRPVVLGIAGAWLALYRLLPVAVRRLFWRSWPPQWPGHLSPSVRQLLHARRLGTAELQAAGFNADGHSMDPLADLQAWQVERLTSCRVRDLSLYRAAFTHKSALPPELRVAQSYERLEFLGDAVLSLACRTLLMERCPTSDEGEMTKLSSLLVSGASNARYAAFLELEHYLVLDPRTLREGGQHTPHILADVFEALLGALYLDAGWAAAHAFCRRVLSACVDWSQVEADAEDWKGVFSRLASHQRRPQPRYRTTSTRKRQFRGGLQLKWYTVDVQYAGEVVGTGSGWERRWAEQAAARQALDNMGQLPGAAAEDAVSQ